MGNSVQTLYNEYLKLFGFLQMIFERQGPEKGIFLLLLSLLGRNTLFEFMKAALIMLEIWTDQEQQILQV